MHVVCRKILERGITSKNVFEIVILFPMCECLPECISVYQVHTVPMEARIGCQIPWTVVAEGHVQSCE